MLPKAPGQRPTKASSVPAAMPCAMDGIGLATLQRIEQSEGVVKGNFTTVVKIQKTLENAGISFSDDGGEIGVRLLKKRR
jgi:hypothetical protein